MDPAIQSVATELGLSLKDGDISLWMEQLSEKINDLLVNDFNRLVSILYRLDIDEKKLKNLLKENPGKDAGKIIAEMIIERQIQKIKSRQQFSQRDGNIDDDEKW